MEIPNKIKILGIDYDIKTLAPNSRDDRFMGRMDDALAIISLRSDMPRNLAEQTLIHEVIHAISAGLGLKISEPQTTALSAGIYAVLKENGWL